MSEVPRGPLYRAASNPLFWGITLSALLACLVLWLALRCGNDGVPGYREFLKGSPNEMGDTLAGIFTSLAFIWIVVSTFIQRAELNSSLIEMRETTRIARGRASLREFEILVSAIEKEFASLELGEAMHGEWSFRLPGKSNLEHATLRIRKATEGAEMGESIQHLHRVISNAHALLSNPTAKTEQKPNQRLAYHRMARDIANLATLINELPRHEARLLEDWKIASVSRLIDEILDNPSYWRDEETK